MSRTGSYRYSFRPGPQSPRRRSRTRGFNLILTLKTFFTKKKNSFLTSYSPFSAPFFTRDPNQLRGDRIRTKLVKSSKGLGFTIVGGDDNVEEFLQIKSVVPNGPAWLDGQLQTGDVLVYVNETCVLGFTHHDMVTMFQSICSGEAVNLEVCRGYPLPFDPEDPYTEIVTTVAVTSPDQNEWASELERQRGGNQSDVQSMPDLSAERQQQQHPPGGYNRPGSADLLGSGPNPDSNNIMSVPITKGGMGFGFTIADSAFGQKVKKILDRPRCKTLQEGDVLLDINGKSVRNMSHSEVVQVLKECSRGAEANITIQRGLLPASSSSPTKSKFMKKSSDSGLLKGKSGFLFRSKTPTAELYSTQEREKVPNRPKTPIVDTRNMSSSSLRSKTPTAAPAFQRNDITRASLGGQVASSVGAGNSFNQYNQPQQTANALSDRMANMGLYSNDPTAVAHQHQMLQQQQQQDYNRARSPGRDLDYYQQQQQQQPQQPQYYADYGQQQNYGVPYGDPQLQQQQQQPQQYDDYSNYQQYYNGYASDQQQQPSQPVNDGYGYAPSRGPQGGGGDGSFSQNYRAGSLPRTVSVSRKESTSFEHSEPHPGGLTRWPRPERRSNPGGGQPHNGPGGNENFVEMTVTLQRHESGFGFRIVGGTEEGSQVRIERILLFSAISNQSLSAGVHWSHRSWWSRRSRRQTL